MKELALWGSGLRLIVEIGDPPRVRVLFTDERLLVYDRTSPALPSGVEVDRCTSREFGRRSPVMARAIAAEQASGDCWDNDAKRGAAKSSRPSAEIEIDSRGEVD